ncbi:hypothetical protein BK049_17405 [Bacillus xiamenensis]|uniref:DUF4397 domain-containing protein n=1 Tax=Bacillus xiamenensis TaxID=1178537 RepID=A0AAC9IKT4_9BACI|nr:DUF4397 domain-containing protein [Bacillus xiamenensis]AOZ90333.1 hypothetical protein BK049_17405 [Bacillus xiamenensis]EKF35611.1 hypothetical protein BA1_09551 [Bacillus xiamenensis]
MQQLYEMNHFLYRPSATAHPYHQRNTSSKAVIRIFHAAPDLSELAVFVNQHQIHKKMPYGQLTAYMEWDEGVYEIEVFKLATKERVLSSRMTMKGNETYTLCITGAHTGFALLTERQDSLIKQEDLSALTFVQLSPDLPPIDIYERDQGMLSKELGYVSGTQTHHFSPNKYHFELKASGTQSVLLDIPKVHLQTKRAYLILLHGFANGEPELMAKVVLSRQM